MTGSVVAILIGLYNYTSWFTLYIFLPGYNWYRYSTQVYLLSP